MLFNSFEYALFLPLVFALYWLSRQEYRWIILLISSCVFYMFFIPYYILILALTIVVDYFAAIFISRLKRQALKKLYLVISIAVTCIILIFFKYFGFFDQAADDLTSLLNIQYAKSTLQIILPIGLSFHTFQSLSYVIEVYRGNQMPEKNFGIYSLYVMFFPQLVAGPIERPQNLLHQFHERKRFDFSMASEGIRQVLWGLFKKIVIADNLASYTNKIFDGYEALPGSTLFIGAVYFSIQIYCDFSGYSDIALGSAKLFGFQLMRNFAYPYFSRDIAEFWRRWHISLSTWFRDYVYFPLGGSKGSLLKVVRNTLVIFLLSGFWHGANWTFVIWGLINALYFMPLLILKRNRKYLEIVASDRYLPSPKELMQMGFTFLLATLAWVFFRAESVSQAFNYLNKIFSRSLFEAPLIAGIQTMFPLIILLLAAEWVQRKKEFVLDLDKIPSRPLRWGIYYMVVFSIVLFGASQQSFIYFQF